MADPKEEKQGREGLSRAATRSVEAAQAGTRGFLKALAWVIPIIGLGVFLYMIFIGSDERRQFTNPEETLTGYTQFVSLYVGVGSRSPDFKAVDNWLTFFDDGSRDFFEDNYTRIARMSYQFELDKFDALSDQARRNDAMAYLVNKVPLSGTVTIEEQRPRDDGKIEVTITNRSLGKSTLVMGQEGALWYIYELGGLLPVVEQEIANFEKYNPPKE